MTSGLLGPLGAKEGGTGPEPLGLDGLIQGGKSIQGAGDQAGFEQVGGNGDVLLALVDTLMHGANRMAHLQFEIPQQCQKLPYGLAHGFGQWLRTQDQDVDIGIGV